MTRRARRTAVAVCAAGLALLTASSAMQGHLGHPTWWTTTGIAFGAFALGAAYYALASNRGRR